jgi:hypothetical protein
MLPARGARRILRHHLPKSAFLMPFEGGVRIQPGPLSFFIAPVGLILDGKANFSIWWQHQPSDVQPAPDRFLPRFPPRLGQRC